MKTIFENMVFEVLCERPENPALFMMKWLIKAGGYNSKLNKAEREELSKLREEIAFYRENSELVNLVEKQLSIISYPEIEDTPRKGEEVKKMKTTRQNRKAVSAEAYGKFNKIPEEVIPKPIQKTELQISRIKNIIYLSFLFNGLDNREILTIINSMEILDVRANQIIIKQGDRGDCMYIVEKGEFNVFKKLPNEKKENQINIYKTGDTFGELALLYNAPREETVKVKTAGTLFKLGRDVFNAVVSNGAKEKREKYGKLLKTVDLFSILDDYEINSLISSVKKCDFKYGDYIIRLGEVGKCLYVIEEGEAIAFGKVRGKNDIKYMKEDIFGEQGLIKDVPSKYNFQALSELKLLAIDRDSFRRIIGPISERLKKKEDLFKKYFSK